VPVGMKGSIFISYRHEEADAFAGRLAAAMPSSCTLAWSSSGLWLCAAPGNVQQRRCTCRINQCPEMPPHQCRFLVRTAIHTCGLQLPEC
jgi:hypothetical protein